MALMQHPNAKPIAVITAVVTAATAIWGFSGKIHDVIARHVDRYFFSTAEAQTLLSEVKDAAEIAKDAAETANATTVELIRYIKRQDLKEHRVELDRLRGDLADTELWESTNNGANSLSRERKADLERRIEATLSAIRCLENPGSSGC
jgi:nucleoid-associated protein YejK